MLSENAWNESQAVLKALHESLSLEYCRRWMVWDVYITSLLDKTKLHCDEPVESNSILKDRWMALVARNHTKWGNVIHSFPIMAEGVDEEDLEEHEFPVGEDEEEYEGNNLDVDNIVGLEWVDV